MFHCSYFIKRLPNSFLCIHLGCRLTFRKRTKTLASGLSIFTFSKSLATFTLHGSRYPALKITYYFLIGITIAPDSFLATGTLLIRHYREQRKTRCLERHFNSHVRVCRPLLYLNKTRYQFQLVR